jgi:hypothetical protein
MTLFWQDPTDKVKRGIDGTRWLTADGDTITSSEWSATPEGLTLEGDIFNTTRAGITISGGTAGVRYRLTNTVGTLQGQSKQRSFFILVEDV